MHDPGLSIDQHRPCSWLIVGGFITVSKSRQQLHASGQMHLRPNGDWLTAGVQAGRLRRATHRKPHGEARPIVRCALDLDPSRVPVDNLLADRQPEAGA
jgi:hypothetical protein